MKKIILYIFILLAYSCNKSQTKNSVQADQKSNKVKKSEIPMVTNISFENIENLSIEEAVQKYPPLRDDTFILGKEEGAINEFRSGLSNHFKQKDIENKNIWIREITWSASEKDNLTVWYHKQNGRWSSIAHTTYSKEAEF
ncbi:hypothetical protein [Apibacter sp. HY039]|uniref:hypothetical protein n=1 Tax=Apibacter sp. HY039 TaxID=2501476 RepID=UPI000FEB9639|nr:hypothetical protein [Apibacter sp. HY039]